MDEEVKSIPGRRRVDLRYDSPAEKKINITVSKYPGGAVLDSIARWDTGVAECSDRIKISVAFHAKKDGYIWRGEESLFRSGSDKNRPFYA